MDRLDDGEVELPADPGIAGAVERAGLGEETFGDAESVVEGLVVLGGGSQGSTGFLEIAGELGLAISDVGDLVRPILVGVGEPAAARLQ